MSTANISQTGPNGSTPAATPGGNPAATAITTQALVQSTTRGMTAEEAAASAQRFKEALRSYGEKYGISGIVPD